MSGFGIVRRMDELGRIVIPKEFRKTLRLSEGDEMEIFSDGEQLFVRRHSGFNGFRRFARTAVKELNRMTHCDVFIIAAEEVVAAAGVNVKIAEGQRASERAAELSLLRTENVSEISEKSIFDVCEDVSFSSGSVISVPVFAQGDVSGALFCAGENVAEFKDYLNFAAQMLGAVLEQ